MVAVLTQRRRANQAIERWEGCDLSRNKKGRAASSRNRVVVIGGGIVGVLTANALLRNDNDVVLIDKGNPEDRCSFGNAGSLSPGSVAPLGMPGVMITVPGMMIGKTAPLRINPRYFLPVLPWLTRFVLASSKERVEQISIALSDLLSDSVERFEQLLVEINATDLLLRKGQLQLYRNRKQKDKDSKVWSLRRRRGVEVQDVGQDDIQHLEPNVGPLYNCGVFLPNEGMVTDPAKLVEKFTEEFVRNGGEILVAKATGFKEDLGEATAVVTDRGNVVANRVVIAAGAWSNELSRLAGDDVPLKTQRGYHITLPHNHGALTRPVVAADRKFFVTPMDMGLRVAGTVEFDSLKAPPNPARTEALASALPELLPDVDVSERTTWMGHRPCMPDSLPVIDRARGLRNVFYAFGNGHLGLTGAPMMAQLVTNLVVDREPNMDISPFRANRFVGSQQPEKPEAIS